MSNKAQLAEKGLGVAVAVIVLLVIALHSQVGRASTIFRNGVEMEAGDDQVLPKRLASSSLAAVIAAPPGAVTIDFDDATAPCVFAETTALRDKFAALGVDFGGPDPNDGGAILNECGTFGVDGHSSPNFLVFNIFSPMSDGGIPQGPETITFDPPAEYVQINAGHILAGTIEMECLDPNDFLVGSDSLVATNSLETLVVAAPLIGTCDLTFTGDVAVFDDLAFVLTGCGNTFLDPGEECDDGNTISFDGCSSSCELEGELIPTLPPWGLLALALLLGTSGYLLRRRLGERS